LYAVSPDRATMRAHKSSAAPEFGGDTELLHMLCLIDIGEVRGPLVSLPLLRPESLERFARVKEVLDRHAPGASRSEA
jgi:hypothetical protein